MPTGLNILKYGNQKCELAFEGQVYRFDSKLERSQANVLFTMLKQDKIKNLVLQKEFVLQAPFEIHSSLTKSGKSRQRAIVYVSDFCYEKDSEYIVVDVKGMKTQVYSMKKKMLMAQMDKFGIDEFQEVYKAEIIKYRISQK